MIKPSYFVKEMDKHWTGRLGNVSNEGLKKGWGLFAHNLTSLAAAYKDPVQEKMFTALQFPTGSGKTQGTILYFSMLSQLPIETRPAGLIITKRIEDTKYIAAEINKFSKEYNEGLIEDVAISYTSENKDEVTLVELASYPVLVITHRAYELALEKLGRKGTVQQTWEFFHSYNPRYTPANGIATGDRRKLIVIDEALDLVEYFNADIKDLQDIPRFFTHDIKKDFPREVHIIKTLGQILNDMNQPEHKETILSKKPIQETFKELTAGFTDAEFPDFEGLREALKKSVALETFMPFSHGKKDIEARTWLKRTVDNLLKSVRYNQKVCK